MELFLFARFHARPGCEDALRDAIRRVEAPTRREPGCLDYQVFRSVRVPGELVIHSRWRDQAAFDLHASLPHTMEFLATAETLIDHPFAIALTERVEGTQGETRVNRSAGVPEPSAAFATVALPSQRTTIAPDGGDVRVLLRVPGASMAHFSLGAGLTARAVTHRSVDEIWYVVAGHGRMWRRQDAREETVALAPGVCVTIPAGTHFQFRAEAAAPLAAIGVTLPPWPGDDEAVVVDGPWPPSAIRA
jgi:mannose-6-phosphate isomerase-like protein (cupin superfamily)/quinol monooxygenase YgiN